MYDVQACKYQASKDEPVVRPNFFVSVIFLFFVVKNSQFSQKYVKYVG